MMVTAGPCYAPEDPTLPKPWKGLVDGKTVYLYFWNPETNVTQYEKPAASSHTGSAPPQKLSSAPVSSSVQVEQSSHGHCDSIFNDDDDRYNGGSNSGSKLDTGTQSYQFLTLAFRLKYCTMGCINSTCMRSLLNYMKHSLSHPFSHSISEKARNRASLLKFYASMMLLSWIIRDNMRVVPCYHCL